VTAAAPPLRPALRRLLLPVYLPWGMATLGAGIVLPVLPLYLEEAGLSLASVGTVTAAAGIGSALGGVPASSVAERRGTDGLMVGAVVLMAVTTVLTGFTGAVVALVAMRVGYGLGFSGLTQSRQLVVARTVEVRLRGRVNSFVGGMHRFTYVVGPVVGGGVYDRWGAEATFVLAGVLTGGGLAALVATDGRDDHPVATAADRIRIGASLWRHRRALVVASLGPLLISSARQGRYVVVPLIGDELALDPTAIGVLVAVGTTADFLLFPVAGWLSDRFGRLASMVPAFSLMAAGLALLGLADTVTQAVIAGVIMGFGNGLSAGSMLTLSTDLAPADEPGPFIAGFHTLSGSGAFLGPLAVGWVADVHGLGAAALVLAAGLMAGVVWLALVIGETAR
jgi:MFS family permease